MNLGGTVGIRGSAFIVSPAGESQDRVDSIFQEHWGRQFRKSGRFIKLALSGAAMAIRDAGIGKLPSERTGVFLGAGLGNISDLLSFSQSALGFGDPVPSPTQFAQSVGNAGAFYVAQAFELRGPVLAISQAEVSFEAALLNAVTMMRAGDLDIALVGGVDAYCPTEDTHLRRMGYEPEAERGIPLGDGAGWVVLERRCDEDIASLESVSLNISPNLESDFRQHMTGTPSEGVVRLALGSRLARSPDKWLSHCAPRTQRFESDSPPAMFLTESAVWTCQFLEAPGPAGEVFQCAALTGEERLGLVTVRRTRERRREQRGNHPGVTK
jgi:hypothetical protein